MIGRGKRKKGKKEKRKKDRRKKFHRSEIDLMEGLFMVPGKMQGKQVLKNGCLRSLIVFCVVFGSVGGFLSAFDITYNYVLVACCYLAFSMYASLLYTAPKLYYRDFGYLVFFALFICIIYVFRIHANSGLYEIVNAVYRQAEIFFDLPGIMEYEVQIKNRYFTVSILAVLVGIVEILILNIWIYVTMGIGWTVFITFPLLIIPLYMKLTPDLFYILLLGFGYLGVIVNKANGHFSSYTGAPEFYLMGIRKKRLFYSQDFKSFLQLLLTLFMLCFVVTTLTGKLMPQGRFENQFKSDELRESTSEIIGNVLMLGIGGLFNFYHATGGMSGGKLGGISNVRPDYQTDLIVSFTPYSSEAVYLKGYTGGIYGDNEWLSLYTDRNQDDKSNQKEKNQAIFEEESLERETSFLEKNYEERLEKSAKGKMQIKNVGADSHYLYYPYYTRFSDYAVYNKNPSSIAQGVSLNKEVFYTYYPLLSWKGLGQKSPSEMDVSKVDAIFLDVPEKNRDVLAAECERIGLTADMSEIQIINRIRIYFDEEIPYTLRPGATPQGEDFVNYFLTKNRKGFCAHFATAATLLFRQMGIPARYVEGYAFSMETALLSEKNDIKVYEDYYDGYSDYGKTAVLDVNVPDAMAHAWVEVYIDDFGWKVVDVTPERSEIDENDFWSAFSDALDTIGGTDDDGGMFGSIRLSKMFWLADVFLFLGVGFIVLAGGKVVFRKIVRFRQSNQKDLREALVVRYRNICDMERICNEKFHYCQSHEEQLQLFHRKYQVSSDYERICRVLEKVSFSKHTVDEKEIEFVFVEMKEIKKAIWKKANIMKKIQLWLW